MNAFYEFLLSIPDRLYPLGRAAYEKAKAADFAAHGDGHYGLTLFLYREAFHLAGGIAYSALALLIARVAKSDLILFALLAALAAFITFQEFWLHPRFYGQPLAKGIADWLAWMLPAAGALFIHLAR